MTNAEARAGCSYFGVRMPRHVGCDMADLAARGYTGVLHTFSENDLAYYRGTMADIVAGRGAPLAWPHERWRTRVYRTARRERRRMFGWWSPER